MLKRRIAALFVALVLGAPAVLAQTAAAPPEPETTWLAMKRDLFGDREIADGAGLIALDAPVRALDAAVTPLTVTAKRGQAERPIKALTLIIDENPSPVVATLTFGPAAPTASVSTRVRVNSYSWVRAIAELPDGTLHMVRTYVKASGGCSAPALKDQDAALADVGRMAFRQFDPAKAAPDVAGAFPADAALAEAQLMIKHPNYSGLQMNQATMLYIPAYFVNMMEIKRGGELVFRLEGGISLSENPNLRFQIARQGAGEISVRAEDTDGGKFDKSWPVTLAGL